MLVNMLRTCTCTLYIVSIHTSEYVTIHVHVHSILYQSFNENEHFLNNHVYHESS